MTVCLLTVSLSATPKCKTQEINNLQGISARGVCTVNFTFFLLLFATVLAGILHPTAYFRSPSITPTPFLFYCHFFVCTFKLVSSYLTL